MSKAENLQGTKEEEEVLSNRRKLKTIIQYNVSPSLPLLLMLNFFIHNIIYCLIMPSQAILVWSDFLWAWSAPKPASPPPLVRRHREDQKKLSLFEWSRRWQHLTSFFLDSKANSTGNDSAFVRYPVVLNLHRDWHHPTLEVLWFLRADLGKTNNKNQYPINILDLPAMRKSIIHPLHQLLAPEP